jgi:hypothetical protein
VSVVASRGAPPKRAPNLHRLLYVRPAELDPDSGWPRTEGGELDWAVLPGPQPVFPGPHERLAQYKVDLAIVHQRMINFLIDNPGREWEFRVAPDTTHLH